MRTIPSFLPERRAGVSDLLHLAFRRLMGVLLLLGLGLGLGTAMAQRGGADDDGEYQILQARYGTAERNVDVTQQLKRLAREDSRFRMGNETFGVDPDPGQRKTLRIYARGRDGQTRTFEYREDSHVDGRQFTGWGGGNWGHGGWAGGWGDGARDERERGRDRADDGQYQILQAHYGTAENHVDVTQQLKRLARQDSRFRMGNDTFGIDPDPGRKKTLRIYARGRDGQPRTFEYREDSSVDGSQFTGWGGGDWGHGGWAGGWDGSGPARPGAGNVGSSKGGLTIISARYGAGLRSQDVTQRVRGHVSNNRLYLKVENSIIGSDPAPGETKTLWVSYRVNGGRTQEARADERGHLSIP